MKKTCLMILLSILVCPSLLFAEENWAKDPLGTGISLVTGTAGAVSGALQTGYNNIAPSLTLNNAVNVAISHPLALGGLGAVYKIATDPGVLAGTQKFYTDLAAPVMGAVYKIATDPGAAYNAGISRVTGAAAAYLPLDIKMTPNNNWSTPATRNISYGDLGKGTGPYDAGKKTVQDLTNYSAYHP